MASKSLGGKKKKKVAKICWQNLPDGIMDDDILPRLPVKSLLRFRCVCKPWLSLFSNPSFIETHLNHHRTTVTDDEETLLVHSHDPKSGKRSISLLKTEDPDLTFNLDHPLLDNHCGMDLIGSINGLVCLSRKTDGSGLILWNPATKEYRNLPPPNIQFVQYQGYASIGFCFDSASNDYKIVRIVLFKQHPQPQPLVELYSVTTDCWREIEVEVPVNSLKSKCDTIVKGEPYWLGYYNGHPFVQAVWFDVVNEVFHKGPHLDLPQLFLGGLVNFENSLALLANAYWLPSTEVEQKINLWVMEDCCSWSLKFTAETFSGMRLVGCSKNGKIVLETATGMLLLYDSKTKESKHVQTDGNGLNFQVSHYTASLVQIRGSKHISRKEGRKDVEKREGTGG